MLKVRPVVREIGFSCCHRWEQLAKILAAMPGTDYPGVTGEINFDLKGDLKQGVVSLYRYDAGKKTLIDVVKM